MSGGETIFALATAPGRAGIAVVRLSGPAAGAALAAMTGILPPPRRAQRVTVRNPDDGDIIDDGLALYFPAPASFTGEDVAELQLHGSRAVIAAVVEVLGRLPGLRPAEPGEFTRRAFFNGKLDLTAVEGLADLIAAETAAQRRQAVRQLGGELGRLYEGWRHRLLRALALVEADIDFPEEGLPMDLRAEAAREVETLAGEIAVHLADGQRGERLRDGVSVAILGPPNAGKSSLLNALARRDVAITAATAGTTRDVIEVALDLGGYPVVLADTAGLREAEGEIEAEGVKRARARAAASDLKLVLVDASDPTEAEAVRALLGPDAILIANKIDRLADHGPLAVDSLGAGPALRLSVATGAGLGELLRRLEAMIGERLAGGGAPVISRARHRAALGEVGAALRRFASAILPELAAEDLRRAVQALGRITGRVDVEDLLDVIFREFCIGK